MTQKERPQILKKEAKIEVMHEQTNEMSKIFHYHQTITEQYGIYGFSDSPNGKNFTNIFIVGTKSLELGEYTFAI